MPVEFERNRANTKEVTGFIMESVGSAAFREGLMIGFKSHDTMM